MKRNLLILAIILLIGFIVNSCGDDEDNKNIYTITFICNGGTIVPSQNVTEGNKAEKPTSDKLGYAFVNWYTSFDFITVFDFNNEIYSNITLFAKWEFDNSLEIGDVGPAGGIIFYVADNEGFIITYDDSISYYLELAPTDIETTLAWASPDFTSTIIEILGGVIGTGKKNTMDILQIDSNAPAALACFNYKTTIGGIIFDDWFLPNRPEFWKISDNIDIINNSGGNILNERYWTSNRGPATNAFIVTFIPGDLANALSKENELYVRPIRAF